MAATSIDLEPFRRWVAQRLGLRFEEHHSDLLEATLRERAGERNCSSVDAYLQKLTAECWPDEGARVATRLTIGETYFFRNAGHFRVLTDALPVLGQSRRSRTGRSRVLCAGCATGEEAYTIAIALQEASPVLAAQTEILAIDVNRDSLARARLARYSSWSLRDTPPVLREKYFALRSGRFELDESIRPRVTFLERNLADPHCDLWQPGAFDVIFCRNVLMYFETEVTQKVVTRMATALSPGGLLFLGHAETLRGLNVDFLLRRSHGAFYYQRGGETLVAPEFPESRAEPDAPAAGPLHHGALQDLSAEMPEWYQKISQASARIATLAEGTGPAAGESVVSKEPGSFNRAFALHCEERFEDALAELGTTAGVSGPDEDRHRLLRAMLLINLGRHAEAQALCAPWLGDASPDAGAFFVAALCRECAGDFEGAERHHTRATEADPTFAMAHFHLGLLFKQLGRTGEARTAFREAHAHLPGEDAERLMLFGAGFNRETLIEACRTELARLAALP